ncbi:MAG: hypothetical protein GY859_42540, partial [Desulfobacterales bacterium]|nr:hypothetical protein [Desulfobacterales bacterium]
MESKIEEKTRVNGFRRNRATLDGNGATHERRWICTSVIRGLRGCIACLLAVGFMFAAGAADAVAAAAPPGSDRIDNITDKPAVQARAAAWERLANRRALSDGGARSVERGERFKRRSTAARGDGCHAGRRFPASRDKIRAAAIGKPGRAVFEDYAMEECRWAEGFGAPGLDGPVFALVEFDDGSGPALYAGGDFLTAGGAPVFGVAKWDGAAWSALGGGMNDHVHALVVFDDGTGPALYAGGAFSEAGSVSASNIAKWDGAAWSAVGGGVNAEVFALTVWDDGGGPALYVGGGFTAVGPAPGLAAGFIAKWNGADWSAVGDGLNGGVLALAVHDDGGGPALFVGGNFTFPDPFPWPDIGFVAKLNGASWSVLGEGVDGYVNSLAVYDDGAGAALYVGGYFLTVFNPGWEAVPASGIAKWKDNAWTALGAGVSNGLDDEVSALAVFDDGGGPALYVGGYFDEAGGAPAANIARWSAAGWAAVDGGVDEQVMALAVHNPGGGARLFAGGGFYMADGAPARGIAQWSGAAWSGVRALGASAAGFDDP